MRIINVSLAKAYENVNLLTQQNSLTFRSKQNSLAFHHFPEGGNPEYMWYGTACNKQLDIVFQSIIIMRIAYAAPAWSSFVTKEQEGKIDALLRRSYRRGFSQHLFTFRKLAEQADHKLFSSTTNPTHCLHQLLPPTRSTQYMQLRDRAYFTLTTPLSYQYVTHLSILSLYVSLFYVCICHTSLNIFDDI